MRFTILFLALISLSFGANKVAIIDVDGMTCPLCTTAIKKSLKKIDGVSNAKVRLNTKIARVHFDDTKVGEKELLEAVKNVGYSGVIKSIKEE